MKMVILQYQRHTKWTWVTMPRRMRKSPPNKRGCHNFTNFSDVVLEGLKASMVVGQPAEADEEAPLTNLAMQHYTESEETIG